MENAAGTTYQYITFTLHMKWVAKTSKPHDSPRKTPSSEEKEENIIKSNPTIFPEANTNAVVFGSLILMITAAKRCLRRIVR